MSTIAALIARAIDTDFDAATRNADAGRFIREAIGRIYRTTTLARGDFNVAGQLTAGNSSFTVAANALHVRTVLAADTGDELDEVSREDLESLQAANTGRGRPIAYAIVGTGASNENLAIETWPTADRTYDFTVIGRFAPPVTDLEDTDQCPLPIDYENLPVYYARSELFALVEDDERMSALWQGKWTDGLRELRSDLQTRSGRNRRVPGTWSGLTSDMPVFHRPGLF